MLPSADVNCRQLNSVILVCVCVCLFVFIFGFSGFIFILAKILVFLLCFCHFFKKILMSVFFIDFYSSLVILIHSF